MYSVVVMMVICDCCVGGVLCYYVLLRCRCSNV